MAKQPELFEQLLPFKWRDVEFPVTRMRVSLAQDLVEHKYWGVDGARVESTGRAPIRFSASIPFTNGIVPGKQERWSVLYPNAMRALVVAFAKKASGTLQHPEFGAIVCKAERLELDWDGGRRGGCEAEASWVETIVDDAVSVLEQPSPVQDILLSALDLDASDADLRSLIPTLPKPETSLADFARSLQAVFDTETILAYRVAGKINSILYRVQALQDSIDRARSALTWPVTQNIQRIKSAGHNLHEKLLQLNRDIIFYVVPGDTTLAGIAAALPDSTIGDIIKLNPQLMTRPDIKRGTTVRYYASKIAV